MKEKLYVRLAEIHNEMEGFIAHGKLSPDLAKTLGAIQDFCKDGQAYLKEEGY